MTLIATIQSVTYHGMEPFGVTVKLSNGQEITKPGTRTVSGEKVYEQDGRLYVERRGDYILI